MSKRLTAVADTEVAAAISDVFDYVVAPSTVSEVFHGYGPIPGARAASLLTEGGMRVGAMRQVANADGSVVDEEIIAFERPHLQAYRIARGLKPPFSWLVRSAEGRWDLAPTGAGRTAITWRFEFELTTALATPFAWVLLWFFGKAMSAALSRVRDRFAARSR